MVELAVDELERIDLLVPVIVLNVEDEFGLVEEVDTVKEVDAVEEADTPKEDAVSRLVVLLDVVEADTVTL